MDNPIKTNRLSNFKNRKSLAAIAVFLVLVLVGGWFVLGKQSAPATDDSMLQAAGLPKLTPEDIGMVVTVRSDKKAIMFELTKADDITKVEYTINYEKELEGEKVPEGILGEMNIADDGITKTDFREFGTCSSGVCRYDKVVSDVTIDLKVTKKDGKEYQVTKAVKL